MNYNRIERMAAQVYDDCNITEFPIDCHAILKHYGLRAISMEKIKEKSSELYTLCISYSTDSFLFREKNLIIYHDTTPQRTRFSLMHELGHYLLHHCYNDPGDEYEANHFASCVLAPRIIINYQENYSSRYLSSVFNISRKAADAAYNDFSRWWRINCRGEFSPWDQKLCDRFYSNCSPELLSRLESNNYSHQYRLRQIEQEDAARRQFDGFKPCPADFDWNNLQQL